MKIQEFRKLIREEVRKVLKESIIADLEVSPETLGIKDKDPETNWNNIQKKYKTKVLKKIKVGETYTVREIFESNNPGQYSITLEEVETMYSQKLGREMGYKSDRFMPLDSYEFAEEVMNKIIKEIEEEIFV